MAYTEIIVYYCKCENDKCRHVWTTRKKELPDQCPKCHSTKWNNPGRQPRLIVEL